MAKKTKSKKQAGEAKPPTVASLRRQLDRLDSEILAAINQRATLARQVGESKREAHAPLLDPEREAEVVRRAVADNPGPLTEPQVRAIFRELISATRAMQGPTRVAYLGPEYTYSHLATTYRFGHSADLMPVATIASVFAEVERGQADFGVVPMENSTDGRVSDTLECFSHSPARICGELPLRIRHCLLGIGARSDVVTVYSKPQALSQCRNWIAQHLPQASPQEISSTAEAARRAKEDKTIAAIASEQAAVNHQLRVLASDIEDNPDNVTRFAIIGASPAEPTGDDKTALMFEIAHEPGALADTMAIFKRNRLNMTWIESFPIPGSRGRYLFFVEFVGHQRELRARRAIAALEKKAVRLEVLGSYAQTEPIG